VSRDSLPEQGACPEGCPNHEVLRLVAEAQRVTDATYAEQLQFGSRQVRLRAPADPSYCCCAEARCSSEAKSITRNAEETHR